MESAHRMLLDRRWLPSTNRMLLDRRCPGFWSPSKRTLELPPRCPPVDLDEGGDEGRPPPRREAVSCRLRDFESFVDEEVRDGTP